MGTDTTVDDTVGRRIRRARRAADLSQADLAARVGVTRQTVNLWENSPSAGMALTVDRLTTIATAVGVTIGQLITDAAA